MRNHSGNTPLHLATEFDHTESVKCLVKGGTNPAIKNNDRMTVLELAARKKRYFEDSKAGLSGESGCQV